MSIFTVTTTNDVATAGKLTLRQAVLRAGDGDTIVFAHGLFGGVELTRNLGITKSITIEGQLGNASLGGSLFMGGSQGSVIVRAGANVKIAHIQVVGGVNGPAGLNDGPDGAAGDNGTNVLQHGTDGSDGENGGKSTSPGFIGSPALINQGHLTLDHVAVAGSSFGGSGRSGGDGGSGGIGGNGSITAGNGGIGGDGGSGSNGASAVGGILNQGTLVLHDSALRFCFAEGGVGGDGGAGGDGGNGGVGGPIGGVGGNGGAGGNGGSGGAGIAGILNHGVVQIEGAALSYGNSAEGGAGGAGGVGGAGGAQGRNNANVGNGDAGNEGGVGVTGSTGSGVIYAGAGPTGGSLRGHAFFEWLGVPEAANTISSAASGGSSTRDFTLIVPREGQISTTDTVHWRVSGGGLTGADFVGGVMPSGTLTYTDNVNSAFLSFHFTAAFAFTGSKSFNVILSNPSTDTVLGSQKVFVETIYAATAGSDTMTGTAGVDQLDGGKGNDLVSGLDGNDNLLGGIGRDSLIGGAGDDTLVGGAGKDFLTGGTGADHFIFFNGDSTTADPDRIWDFHHAEHDVISFGFLAHSFVGTADFGGTSGEIRYTTDSVAHLVHVFFDSNGDKVADSEVVLSGTPVLVAADFGF